MMVAVKKRFARARAIIVSAKDFIVQRRWLYLLTIASPIFVVYGLGLFSHFQNGGAGDLDYFYSNYAAIRETILTYHQFPWWNPWMEGGLPLYADPQIGLVSIQTLMVLIFDVTIGVKLSVMLYVLIGFFGTYKFMKDVLKTPESSAILLSLTWGLAWFWSARAGGHLTFLLLAFFPWLLYIYYRRKTMRKAWLWLGLTLALVINGAAHNTTVMMCFVIGLIAITEMAYVAFRQTSVLWREIKSTGIFFAKALTLAAVLSLHELFFAYRYTEEYKPDRTLNPEYFPGWNTLYQAIWGIFPQDGTLRAGWDHMEVWLGIGLGSLIVGGLIAFTVIRYRNTRKKGAIQGADNITSGRIAVFTTLALLCLLLAAGDFARFAPYSLLRELPVFQDTRVATRWLLFFGFFYLCLLACYRGSRFRTTINIVLAISLLPVMYFDIARLRSAHTYAPIVQTRSFDRNQPPAQLESFGLPRSPHSPYDNNLYGAVVNHVDQIVAGLNPLISTMNGNTIRCDESKADCSFILSKNAKVVSWSPNRIVLQRTDSQKLPIELNINPSKYWLVNDSYIFADMRSAEPLRPFIITDTSSDIVIEYAPVTSAAWFAHRL